MRIDGTIGGQILYWEMNPCAMLRVEMEFKKPFSELQKQAAYSEAVQQQFFISGFFTSNDKEISQEYLNELAAKDEKGFTDFITRLKQEIVPPKVAPLSNNSDNGAKSDLAPKATGSSRTGKSRQPLKGASKV